MSDLLGSSQLLAPLFSSAAMRAVMDDRARLQRMLDFEAALARAEAALGVIPASVAGEIADACKAERYDIAVLAEAAAEAGNIAIPLINSLTAEVRKRDDKAASYVHWGATSQDVIDTALMLELRAAIDVLLEDIDRATRAFTTLAGKHRRTMTLARTHLQHALPMPFGLKLAGYAAALGRSRDRLRRLRREALAVQFGGAAGTLAALGEHGLDVSDRVAALLDLPMADAPWHSHRDRLAEIASVFAILAGTCGKIARDVALLMQSEVAEAFEPPPLGKASSAILPHKRNPNRAGLALSAALAAPNLAATLLAAQIHEHERAVGGWQAEWLTFPALALVVSGTLHAIADIAEGLEVDVERMKANLERTGGLVLAEAVSFALAEKIGKAEAHALVAKLSLQADKDKRAFREVVEADTRIKAQLTADEISRLFYPTSYQGSAQTFIDRLVASANGRAIRRPTPAQPAAPKAETAPAIVPEPAAPAVPVARKLPRATPMPSFVIAQGIAPLVSEHPAPEADKSKTPSVTAPPRTPDPRLEPIAAIDEFLRSANAFANSGRTEEPAASGPPGNKHKPT